MFPKGSPVLAVEQGWTPFFCNYCGFPGETEAVPGLVYPTLRMGYIASPHAKPVSKVRQLLLM